MKREKTRWIVMMVFLVTGCGGLLTAQVSEQDRQKAMDLYMKLMAVTETGDWPDAMTGGTMKVRAVTKIIGPDEFVYEMFMQGPDGKEFQTLKNEARRKK